VVEVRSDPVLVGQTVHPGLLREMLGLGLTVITGQDDPRRAWHTLLTPDDVVGLKFNQVGAANLGSRRPWWRPW
jgi:hypothetical protein